LASLAHRVLDAVQLAGKAAANDAPAPDGGGRVVDDGPSHEVNGLGAGVQARAVQRIDRLSSGHHLGQASTQLAHAFQSALEADQLTRLSDSLHDAVRQPFQVAQAAQQRPQRGAAGQVAEADIDSGEACLEGVAVEQRLGYPAAQQAPPHRGKGLVQDPKERPLDAAITDRLRQFQATARGGVQGHETIDGVGGQPRQLRQGRRLVLAQVLHHHACRALRQGTVLAAIAGQGRHLKVIEQRLAAIPQLKAPVVVQRQRGL